MGRICGRFLALPLKATPLDGTESSSSGLYRAFLMNTQLLMCWSELCAESKTGVVALGSIPAPHASINLDKTNTMSMPLPLDISRHCRSASDN